MFHRPAVFMAEALPAASLSEQTGLLEPIRAAKSPDEITLIEEAGRIAQRVLLRLFSEVAVGVREHELNAAMTHEQLMLGADPQTFNLMTSGPVNAAPGRWHLLHGVETLTRRPLARGDLILTEFHVGVAGYLAAAEFSIYLGKAPRQLRRLHEVSMETLDVYREVFKPGVSLGDAVRAVRRPCLEAGLAYLELGFHGHGLGSPEWPTIVYPPGHSPLGGDGLEDVELREGMVFGTNIDLHDPVWSTGVGLMLGDTIEVTPSGGRPLVGTPAHLFEKDIA
jgi:Xaa-Pro aminopeptidase